MGEKGAERSEGTRARKRDGREARGRVEISRRTDEEANEARKTRRKERRRWCEVSYQTTLQSEANLLAHPRNSKHSDDNDTQEPNRRGEDQVFRDSSDRSVSHRRRVNLRGRSHGGFLRRVDLGGDHLLLNGDGDGDGSGRGNDDFEFLLLESGQGPGRGSWRGEEWRSGDGSREGFLSLDGLLPGFTSREEEDDSILLLSPGDLDGVRNVSVAGHVDKISVVVGVGEGEPSGIERSGGGGFGEEGIRREFPGDDLSEVLEHVVSSLESMSSSAGSLEFEDIGSVVDESGWRSDRGGGSSSLHKSDLRGIVDADSRS